MSNDASLQHAYTAHWSRFPTMQEFRTSCNLVQHQSLANDRQRFALWRNCSSRVSTYLDTHISMSCSGSYRTEKDKVLQQFATHLAWFVSFQIDFSPTLAAALITGGNMSAIHDAVSIPQIRDHKMLTLAFAFTRHQCRQLGHVCATNMKELGCTGSVPSTARPAASARRGACASYAAHNMLHATGGRTCVSYQAPDPMPSPPRPTASTTTHPAASVAPCVVVGCNLDCKSEEWWLSRPGVHWTSCSQGGMNCDLQPEG